MRYALLVAGVEGVMIRVDLRDRDNTVELVRKGVDAPFAQALELRPAVVHGGEPTDRPGGWVRGREPRALQARPGINGGPGA